MQTAFGRAMLATINGQPQRFRMTMEGGSAIDMDCCAFLTTRSEENQLLDGIELPEDGAVLDVGCGIGRHLKRIRQKKQSAVHCWGVDICDLMLNYCRETIATPATFVRSLDELPDRPFDLIILMGNGLGVLGHEKEAVAHIRRLVASLTPTGKIVIETGNPFGQGYSTFDFTIDYDGQRDSPFPWGYADRDWVARTMQNLGCDVKIQPSRAPGGMFFIAIGQRGEQGVAPDPATRGR